MALPRFVLLKSNANNKYLRYIKEKANHGYLRFSYEVNDREQERASVIAGQDSNISYHHLRFEVEKSKTFDGLVHIRSCYNNKYWIRKSTPNNYIAAEAHEVEDDQSKLSCTLFKPILFDTYVDHAFPTCKAHKIQLLHVCGSAGLRSLRASTSSDDSMMSYLAIDDNQEEEEEVFGDSGFTAIDVEESAIFPKYVTFMGHNNKYSSSASRILNRDRLSFSNSDIIGENSVANEVVETNLVPQAISLRDLGGLKSWQNDGGFITLRSLDKNTHFTPMKIGNDYIALTCFDNTRLKFVGSTSDDDLIVTSFNDTCMLRVGEPVISREVTDATYDLEDSRIYSVDSFEIYRDTRSNLTEVEQEGSFEVKYTTQRNMKWSQSATVNLGITFDLSFGIPMIVSTAGVGLSFGKSKTLTWDEELTDTNEITYTQTVRIPPNTKVTLKVVAKRGFCNVPFTCNVHDVMADGSVREYLKTDGLYSGCNEFQFDTEIIPEDLPAIAI